jgi:hypothetical protein
MSEERKVGESGTNPEAKMKCKWILRKKQRGRVRNCSVTQISIRSDYLKKIVRKKRKWREKTSYHTDIKVYLTLKDWSTTTSSLADKQSKTAHFKNTFMKKKYSSWKIFHHQKNCVVRERNLSNKKKSNIKHVSIDKE